MGLWYTKGPSSVVRRPSSVVIVRSRFQKHFLLRNHWTDWSQVLYGISIPRGTKVYITGPVHMTKMAVMPIYDKNKTFKIVSRTISQMTFGTWHIAKGPRALEKLCKWTWVDIDVFNKRVNFVHSGFYILKSPSTLQTSSSQKPLDQLKSDFIWNIYAPRERTFINLVLVTWSRWPPCPYMVKTLQNSSPEP